MFNCLVKTSSCLFHQTRFWDIWAILQPQAYRLHGLQPQHTLLLLDFFVAVKKSRRNTDHSDLKSDRRRFFVKTLRTRAESDYQIINFSQSVAQTDFTALIGVIRNNRGKTDTSDLIWKKGSQIFIRKKTGQIFKEQ